MKEHRGNGTDRIICVLFVSISEVNRAMTQTWPFIEPQGDHSFRAVSVAIIIKGCVARAIKIRSVVQSTARLYRILLIGARAIVINIIFASVLWVSCECHEEATRDERERGRRGGRGEPGDIELRRNNREVSNLQLIYFACKINQRWSIINYCAMQRGSRNYIT